MNKEKSHQKKGKSTMRKRYHKPSLSILGDLRSLTLGPSLGSGESGNPAVLKS